jgi:type II secretory pathway component PulF
MPTGSLRGQFQELADSLSRARLASELRNNRLIMQWLPLLASGFTADTATERLSGLIAHASREALDRSQRRRLLAYPLLLVVITLGVFFGFSVLIVPGFSSMFDDFGVQVPGATRSVIFVSDQLRFHPLRCLVIAALCAIAVYTLARVWVHFALTTRLFGGYVAGNSASVSAMASLTSQLAELLSIDIPLPDALWIAGQNCPHYHFQHVAQRLARFAQESGRPLGESPDARYLPANVMLALQVGGGRPCAALLRELSAMYSDRVGGRSDWVAGGMAQLAIVLVGIAVAFLVIALLAPLFSLISGLT